MRSLLLLLSLALFMFGCGGSDDGPARPASKPQQANIPTPPPKAAASARPARPAVRPAAANKPDKKTKDESPEQITSKDFLYSPDAPRFEMASQDERAEQLAFVVLPPRVDSNHLVVNEPELELPQRTGERPTLKLPKNFSWLIEYGLNSNGYPNRLVSDLDESEMVLIEGGAFIQGSDLGAENASPQVNVYVSPFYIDVTEVTIGQYKKFQDEEESVAEPVLPEDTKDDIIEAYPALGIPFNDAVKYAEWVGKSLPTEAEWERAARGPEGNMYPWGNGRPPLASDYLGPVLPIRSRPLDLTHTGLYDMASNAKEWVSDWYSSKAYQELAKSNGVERDPEGPKIAEILGERVVRGSHSQWSLWVRDHANLRRSAPDVGFRCVLRITDEMLPDSK